MKVSLLLLALLISTFISAHGFCLDAETNVQDVDNIISKMTPAEKVGQLLMIGIANEKISPDLKHKIQKINPGFLILFRRNIRTPLQTARLIYDSQMVSYKKSKIQMLVAVDQEGGDVVRIPTWPPLPTALALGRSHDLASAFAIGKNIGTILINLGIQINLAPVLDLSNPEKNSFIQSRSFGDNPVAVADIADEFSAGVEAAGVLSTAKHFPGLGDLSGDSHKEVVENNVTKKDFLQKYLVPYEKLIKKKSLSCIMMTHLIYPNLDPSDKPATFSKTIVNLLKEKLHFSGLVMTDDIEMAGAKYYKDPASRAVEAFLAGNDVLMIAWNARAQRAAALGLLRAYEGGVISEERINSSLKKILNFKLRLGLFKKPQRPNSKIILSSLRGNELKIAIDSVFDKILSHEFSKYDGFKETFAPSARSKARILVLASDYNFFKDFSRAVGENSSFAQIGRRFQLNQYLLRMTKADLIVFDVRGPQTSLDLSSLPKNFRKKTIVVNSGYEGFVQDESSYLAALQISMKHPELAKKIGEWLAPKLELRSPANFN